jgi:hypothetical protein
MLPKIIAAGPSCSGSGLPGAGSSRKAYQGLNRFRHNFLRSIHTPAHIYLIFKDPFPENIQDKIYKKYSMDVHDIGKRGFDFLGGPAYALQIPPRTSWWQRHRIVRMVYQLSRRGSAR